MSENDRTRQVLIYLACIIAVVVLSIVNRISGDLAIGAITSIITYVAGRYTPYQEEK